ncbi:MAG: chorismate lyase [Magnetococcales bacterium]|nr:chorismate lyase [Magnetococcales bacterium]
MPHLYTLQLLNPWQQPEVLLENPALGCSADLKSALKCTGSLTSHLENQFKQTVEIQLINQEHSQDWENNPNLWSKKHTFESKKGVTLRNVWLQVGGDNILFAHSQLALNSLTSSTRQDIKAGRLPLGSLLLQSENAIERQLLEISQAIIPDLATDIGSAKDRVFWCRRSLFLINGAVSARILEVFLINFD